MNNSGKLPPGHQWVPTEDGSFTLFSEAYQEACHSTSGAKNETILHYIKGCQIEEKIHAQDSLCILEVGFGLGLGFLTTYETLSRIQKPWTFISLEIDPQLLEWFRLEHMEHEFLRHLKWHEKDQLKTLEAHAEHIHLVILCGDARKTLPHYMKTAHQKWDAIYQDAFSPKRNPVLWTVSWFKTLKEYANFSTIMSTYSASSSIRKSMLEAGWVLKKGEKFGPKRTSTRAHLIGESDPEILEQLQRSPVSALRDQ